MRLLKLFCIFILFSTVIAAQDFGDEGIDAIQPPNPPTDVVATGYNAGIKITWVKSTTIHVDRYYLYEDGNQIDYVNSTGQTYYTYYHSEPTLHVKHTYTVKAAISDNYSVASNTSDAYSIRKFYVSQSGTGDGSSYSSAEGLERVNGSNWETYDRYPYEGFEDGFFMGDTIYFVGTSPFTSAITLPTSGTFPKQVTDMPNSPIFYLGAQAEPGTSGRPQPVFNGGADVNGNNGNDVFQTNGCNYIHIAYLKFEDWGKDKDAITMLGTSNSQVDNCTFNFNRGSRCIKVQSNYNPSQPCTSNVISNNTVIGGNSSRKVDWGGVNTANGLDGDGDFIQLGREDDLSGEDFGGHIIRNNYVVLQNSCPPVDPRYQQNPDPPHSDIVQIYRMKNSDSPIKIYQNMFIWKEPDVMPDEYGEGRTSKAQGIYIACSLAVSDAGGEVQIYNNIILLKGAGEKALGYNNISSQSEISFKVWNNTIYSTTESNIIVITNPKSGLEMINNIIYEEEPTNITYPFFILSTAPDEVNNSYNFYIHRSYYNSASFARIGSSGVTWAQWTTNGYDHYSDYKYIYSTTVFDNPGGEDPEDYHIEENEYVNQQGTDLSNLFETDYYGHFRTVWDRGAINSTIAKKINTSLHILDNFEIYPNYPNPFNPITKINYNLPEKGLVHIKVFDILGKEIISLQEEKNAGLNFCKLNLIDFTSGVYFYSVTFNNKSLVRKMMLTK